MDMSRILIISNIPSPYRTALFSYLQASMPEHRWDFLYTSVNEDDRAWQVNADKLANTHILQSRVLRVKGGEVGGTAVRFIHIPQSLDRQLSRINPDVVIASEYNISAVQALFWAKLHGRKYINLTDGTLHSETYIGKVQKLTRKLIISNADAFLASGTKAKEKLLHWGAAEERIFLSFLTVDTTPFRQLMRQPEKNRLLYVGRLSHEKGVDLLLDALAQCKEPCQLRIVGNDVGGELALLRQKAQTLKLEASVTWCGYKEGEALLEEYRKAAALVVPSRSDCFGLVMVEAISAGIPIVASQYADGAYDIVTEGKTGWMADPFDPAAFGSAIDKTLTAEGWDAECQRQTAEKFAFSAVAEGYKEAVARVTGE